MESDKIPFWSYFRLVFVLFSLYLLGDVFYRWDGVSYYASFMKFLPGISLASIIWSGFAILVTIAIWFSLKTVTLICRQVGWKIDEEAILLPVLIFALILTATWVGKRYLVTGSTTLQIKLIILIFLVSATVFLSWILRGKLSLIQERITPLLWLFGIFVVLSIPLVMYHTWIKTPARIIPQQEQRLTESGGKKPNILLITFDALTARDMSLYGYERQTTPFIDKWAKEAIVFTKAEAVDNYTFPTTFSLMTGKRPWTHRQTNPHGQKFRKTVNSLPYFLKKNGYYNAAFIQNSVASVVKLGISNDFDLAPPDSDFYVPYSFQGWVDMMLSKLFGDKILYYDWITKNDFPLFYIINKISQDNYITPQPVEKVFNRFFLFLDDNPPEPYFVWMHLNPPHDPYLPDKPYIGMFNSSPDMRTANQQYSITRNEDLPEDIPDEMKPRIDTLRDRYNEFITYCDDNFKSFIDQLQKKVDLKNTIIMLSSDHGESFEHGYITHGGHHLYEQVTHIPLIIKEPGQKNGAVINNLVEQIDIPPTILELADITAPSSMEGRSLVPLMRGERLSPRPVFSMSLYRNPMSKNIINKGTIAVRQNNYKLIHYITDNKSLLYNLKQDPLELDNLFDTEPLISNRLMNIMRVELKLANERISLEFDKENAPSE